MSWDDVQSFLQRINALVPGLGLTLPTEAQWEYACRAGSQSAVYTGDLDILGQNDAPALDPIAWYGGNSGIDFDLAEGTDSSGWREKQYPHSRAGTRPVGLKTANAWGLYDMLGNVWEWCHDSPRAYTDEAVTDPVGQPGARRVLRGGGWFSFARYVRSACRGAFHPGDPYDGFGFRCAGGQEDREPGRGPEAPGKAERSPADRRQGRDHG